MCHFCERPCWRDGSDGGRDCDYTDEEWNRMEREEWEELNRKYGIAKPVLTLSVLPDAARKPAP